MKSQKNSGYTLITTMLIMIILFVIGAAGAMLVYYGNLTSGAMTNYQKAYYNADYGLQQVAYEVINNAMNNIYNCQNNGYGMQTPLPTGGSVTVITQADTNNNTCFIESIGKGQTGGKVVKAIAIATNTSPFPALYIGAKLSVPLLGSSINVNGCYRTCPGPGVILGSPLDISLGILDRPSMSSYCSPGLASNLNGVYGNPPVIQNTNILSIIGVLSNDVSTLLNGIVGNITNLISNPSCSCLGVATASNGTITCSLLLLPSYNLSSSCQAYYITGLLNIYGSNDFTGKQIYASAITISGNNLTIKGGLLDAYLTGLSIDVNGKYQIGTPDDPTAIISQGVNVGANVNTDNALTINGFLLLNNSISVSASTNPPPININGAAYVNVDVSIPVGDNSSINLNTSIIRQLSQEYPVLGLKPPSCTPPQETILNAVTLY